MGFGVAGQAGAGRSAPVCPNVLLTIFHERLVDDLPGAVCERRFVCSGLVTAPAARSHASHPAAIVPGIQALSDRAAELMAAALAIR
jgi:hypothetical protein